MYFYSDKEELLEENLSLCAETMRLKDEIEELEDEKEELDRENDGLNQEKEDYAGVIRTLAERERPDAATDGYLAEKFTACGMDAAMMERIGLDWLAEAAREIEKKEGECA